MNPGSVLDRGVGFCCGEEEEEDLDTDMHSPTDASEDSVDVRVRPICGQSKRKSGEPRRFSVKNIKKGAVLTSKEESEGNPFRPWSQETPSGYIPRGYPLVGDQDEPLSLVLRDETQRGESVVPHAGLRPLPGPQEVVRLEQGSGSQEDPSERQRSFSVESLIRESPSTPSPSTSTDKRRPSFQPQRNYKNMTRERRVEANARERTRVHTISAAFDTLRRAVPAYSHNQKLSKLSVLRIACSYILTLGRVAGVDYSADGSQPSLADCVDNVSRTIQMEGKLRKKKDD